MRCLTLLALRCRDIEASKAFYECLGISFKKEIHGNGPMHYAHEDSQGCVFELYPAREGEKSDRVALGFGVSLLKQTFELMETKKYNPSAIKDGVDVYDSSFVVRDPDDRRIEVKDAGVPF